MLLPHDERGGWDVPMRWAAGGGGEAGQAQILSAVMLGIVMLTASLYSLQHAQQTSEWQVKSTKRMEMRSALDLAIKHAAYLYHFESGCDPVVLNDKLAYLNLDGSQKVPTAADPFGTLRQMNVTVNSITYRVAFGPLSRLTWTGNASPVADPVIASYLPSLSQDVLFEVWTSAVRNRVVRRAVFINTCTHPCSSVVANSSPCEIQRDRSIAYHRITTPGTFPGGSAASPDTSIWGAGGRRCGPGSARAIGDVTATAGTLDVYDLVVLQTYLRSGDVRGSGGSSVLVGAAGVTACGDLNNDQLVDERDLNIVEKILRGYLYWTPSHY